MTSWFIVDFISIIPFDLILDVGNINRIARISRIGKLYRIIKITKLFRLIKTVKVRNKLAKHLTDILKISLGMERAILMFLTFIILQHIAACIWIFAARQDEQGKLNWIYQKNLMDAETGDLYLTSFYFTVTTVLTVGYGDITPYNNGEKFVCITLMLIGVISFSFATGVLSSIISSYDSKEALLKEKISTLNELKKQYKIDKNLFNRLARTIRYDHRKSAKDISEFMDELPNKLRLELSILIHQKMYSRIKFFKGKENSFIGWIAGILKSSSADEQEYLYKEGEHVTESKYLLMIQFYNGSLFPIDGASRIRSTKI